MRAGADVATLTRLPRRARSLHSSGTSDVYVATRDAEADEVVVKRTKITCPADLTRFEKELELLLRCEHASVVRPVAVVRSPPTYALVLPMYAGGALFAMLHASGRTLAPAHAVRVCGDVAAALAHIHSCGVLHRDVKSDNVLIGADGRAVLADFNAAEAIERLTADIIVQARPSGGFFKQFIVGTLPYMAPELLKSVRGAAFTASCDVYSLGITINEVLTATVPYADALTEQVQLHTILEARYNHDQLTAAIVADGLRPREPAPSEGAPPELIALVRRCWSAEPAERPDAARVCSELRPIADAVARGSRDADVGADVGPGAPAPGAPAMAAATPAAERAEPIARAPPAPPSAGQPSQQVDELAALLGCGATCRLRVGAEASAGKRGDDRMEDRHVLRQAGGACVAAVFDGHNGDGAAEFCAAELLPELLRALRPMDVAGIGRAAALDTALSRAFVGLNERFLAEQPRDDSGCTALAVLCLPELLLVANAGDAQAWLWRGDEVLPLNREHNASDEAERQRVVDAGAKVMRRPRAALYRARAHRARARGVTGGRHRRRQAARGGHHPSDALHRRPPPPPPRAPCRAGDPSRAAGRRRPRAHRRVGRAVGRDAAGAAAPLPHQHGQVAGHARQAPALRRDGARDPGQRHGARGPVGPVAIGR